MDEVVLLLSGGMDSTTLLADLTANGKSVNALSFDYGQRHQIELKVATLNAKRYGAKVHHIIPVDTAVISGSNFLTDKTKTNHDIPLDDSGYYVPGRNLLMISHAGAYAEANGLREIYLAANADDGKWFPDCTESFVDAINGVWNSYTNTAPMELLAPYIKVKKAAIIRRAQMLGVELDGTISCYAPNDGQECTFCLSCRLRKEAFNEYYDKLERI